MPAAAAKIKDEAGIADAATLEKSFNYIYGLQH